MIIGGLVLPEPQSWRESDGQVEAEFMVADTFGADKAERDWLRCQVLGLQSSVEVADPVVSSVFPERDGWYRVGRVEVSHVLGLTETKGGFRVRLSLARLGSHVRVVTLAHGGVVSNDHGLNVISDAEVRGWVAMPDSGGYDGPPWVPVASESGSVRRTDPASMTLGASAQMAAQVSPDYALRGACTVEALFGGEWRLVTGRDIPAGVIGLRVGNGRVRASMTTTVTGKVVTEWWDEVDGWGDPFEVELPGLDIGVFWEVTALSRASATIRTHGVSSAGRIIVDVSARRGDVNVSVVAKSAEATGWVLEPGAWTSLTTDSRALGYGDHVLSVPFAWTDAGVLVAANVASQVCRFGVGKVLDPAELADIYYVAGAYYAQWWPTELVR